MCLVRFGSVVAAGFLVGAIIAYVNHVWLERMIGALGERITSGHSRERGGIIVARAVLRYAFIALGAYVIFRVSSGRALRLSGWRLPHNRGDRLRGCS